MAKDKIKTYYIHDLVTKIQKHSQDLKFKKLGEKLEELRDKHEQGLITSIEFLKLLLELAKEAARVEKEVVPEEEIDRGKAALTQLFNGLKNNKTCQAYIKMAEAKKSGDIDYLISTCEKVFSKDLSPRVIYNMGGVGANATQAQRDRWNSFLRRVGAETGK